MGPADIARVMNVPEGSVKARLFRARKMVKAKLTECNRSGARPVL
jgi:DNA-directed RNA polymerase specialized sigma24 family protein